MAFRTASFGTERHALLNPDFSPPVSFATHFEPSRYDATCNRIDTTLKSEDVFMETRQPESSDRSQRSTTTTTTTTLPPNHTNAILNPLSISQPSLLPRSTASTSTSERSSYFFIFLATTLWVWISQNRLAVLGAGVTFAGFVIGLAALVPAFAGQDMSQEALELARWTAMKDFIEQCWERKVSHYVPFELHERYAAAY